MQTANHVGKGGGCLRKGLLKKGSGLGLRRSELMMEGLTGGGEEPGLEARREGKGGGS